MPKRRVILEVLELPWTPPATFEEAVEAARGGDVNSAVAFVQNIGEAVSISGPTVPVVPEVGQHTLFQTEVTWGEVYELLSQYFLTTRSTVAMKNVQFIDNESRGQISLTTSYETGQPKLTRATSVFRGLKAAYKMDTKAFVRALEILNANKIPWYLIRDTDTVIIGEKKPYSSQPRKNEAVEISGPATPSSQNDPAQQTLFHTTQGFTLKELLQELEQAGLQVIKDTSTRYVISDPNIGAGSATLFLGDREDLVFLRLSVMDQPNKRVRDKALDAIEQAGWWTSPRGAITRIRVEEEPIQEAIQIGSGIPTGPDAPGQMTLFSGHDISWEGMHRLLSQHFTVATTHQGFTQFMDNAGGSFLLVRMVAGDYEGHTTIQDNTGWAASEEEKQKNDATFQRAQAILRQQGVELHPAHARSRTTLIIGPKREPTPE